MRVWTTPFDPADRGLSFEAWKVGRCGAGFDGRMVCSREWMHEGDHAWSGGLCSAWWPGLHAAILGEGAAR